MLSKPLASEFVPGTPEVPARAAFTECSPTPAPGYWETTCAGVYLPVGYQCTNGGVTSPSHDHSTDPVIYRFVETGPCRSRFVQTGPPGPVVCTSYPAQQHVPARAPRWERHPDFGWNAGGNSVAQQVGDFLIRDTMGLVTGVAWGITQTRENVTNPARITHGFMFTQTAGGQPRFAVVESGKTVLSAQAYAIDDLFAIRRIGGRVQYEHEDVVIYRSQKPSIGAALVGSSLYASGDQIP
ncbi:MAG TPA: hypothetical protein VGE09_06260 [Pseudoxanthomonas sp.]